ncbi:MAG: hypothetical protein K2H98_08315 [Duncaniella sp.]|nr:hypothetical protein [Duncaniella sp.]
MKKSLSFVAVAAMMGLLASCNGDKLRMAEETNTQLRDDLSATLATQDSLLVLVNDISEGMNQIKDMEKIISTPGALNDEAVSRREQVKNDMIAIQQALQERRKRLEELEASLAKANGNNATLTRTIQNLKSQIAEQQTEMASLVNQLEAANIRISELDQTVADLNSTVDSLNTDIANVREDARAEVARAEATANTVYYALGTNKELKDRGILEKKFLGRTHVLEGDFDREYFTAADSRTLTSIPTHSDKTKLMTDQPKESYTIEDHGGQKVIVITNPALFWEKSKFLVIKVD